MLNLNDLNPKQREAVEVLGGPILIFAGAGSGKTRVLTYKIAYLVEKIGLPPEHILAVTFTNKAASEMKERVSKLLPGLDVSRMSVGTFHSISARILRREIHHLGYSPDFTIYDQDDSRILVKTVVKKLNLDVKQFDPRGVQSMISKLKNNLQSPDDYRAEYQGFREEKIADIYEHYQEDLKRNNSVDFDDLLLLPLALFDNFPDRKEWFQDRYQYVLVDEYQDTNRPQFEFINAISEKHREICVVGDDDQSIYGWRGADIRNILEFSDAYKDAKTIKLEQNYRSTKSILNASHAVIEKNEKRAAKKLWTENEQGEKIGLLQSFDERTEAKKLVESLQTQAQSGRTLSDQVILYRINAQSRPIEDEFRRQGIPYIIIGGVKFYERKEIKDILAYLRVIVNPEDAVALERIINFPPRNLGNVTVEKLKELAAKQRKSLFEILRYGDRIQLGPRQKNSLTLLMRLFGRFQENLENQSADDMVRELLKALDLESFYTDQNNDEALERWSNVMELISSVEEFCEINPQKGIREFLEEVSLLTDIDRWNVDTRAVTMMTLHSAKGLEFPVVYIAGMEEGLFPLSRSSDDEDQLAEERRLFYVGMTRAMKKVFLSFASQRRRFGQEPIPCIPSRFIADIPPELLDIPVQRRKREALPDRRSYSPSVSAAEKRIDGEFIQGDIILHKMFGKGRILDVEGHGENAKLTIGFSGGVRKKFVARYANLKRI